MHDLIREMGRAIVSSESPGKRSRLWDPKLALNVIKQKQGTFYREGIQAHVQSQVSQPILWSNIKWEV
ncbi:hypothetical protein MLD38_036597 [Melastoma candidum]|uniref:Uncharacterized protein n=1 Tax=Melastoma candidum TaxID=119954 RepID=A0ACB9LKL1_9MYRT|nr:hypothetical protein MLD38_036597 [Melastoma candidum]